MDGAGHQWRVIQARGPQQARHGLRSSAARGVATRRAGGGLAAALLAYAAVVSVAAAHHAFGAFDLDTELVLRGEVVSFDWVQPHTSALLDVTNDDGTVTRWTLEGRNPSFLGQRGWSRYTLSPGDRIEAVVYPLKSGAPSGTLARITLADGTLKVLFTRAPR